jgi:type IV secretion system protein TrbJ
MKKTLWATAAATALFLNSPAHSQQAVLCTNCNTLAQEVLVYARQLQQLQTEIGELESDIQNTLAIPGTVYHDLTGDIQQIEQLSQQANMLTGQMGSMITNLGSTSGYPSASIQNWRQWLTNEDNAVSTTMKAAAQVLNLLPGQLSSDASTLANLNSQALGTNGRQATLQSLAGSLSQMGQGQQKQEATLATAMQAMISYQTTQRDQDAVHRAVEAQDLETAWVQQCQAITALGGTAPSSCQGATQQ